jgi:hypothetical protein
MLNNKKGINMKQVFLFVMLAGCLTNSPLYAQQQTNLNWQVVSSGAGLSLEGSNVLFSLVGEALGGSVSSDATTILSSGFIGGVSSKVSSTPEDNLPGALSYKLEQNYPNPFNPVTTVPFSLAERSRVVIKLYDILGRTVKTVLNAERPAGRYEVSINAINLASGIYFYRMVAGKQFVSIKKMIILK